MKIVVTGGEGFIGSQLCFQLSKNGYDIHSVDRRTRDNLYDNNFECDNHKLDICDHKQLKEIISKVDGIIHLAGVSRVVWGEQFPNECFDINIKGTNTIIDLAKKSEKRPWIIFGSSREIYGETNGNIISEDFQPNPINIYGTSKLAAELLVKQYSFQNKRKATILRFSNVYGNLSDILDRVTPKFILNALLDEPLQIHGGEQIMDFTHIDDTVTGILKTVEHLNSLNQQQYFEHFHLLPGKPHSLYDLIEYIKLYTSNNLDIKYGKQREYDVVKFVGDPSKTKETLDFNCRVSFQEGVRRTVNLFKEGLKDCRDRVLQKFEEDKKCELL